MTEAGEEPVTATLPLDGLTVLDMGHFLAAPTAATRLADLGAAVIKIERAGSGDGTRRVYNNDQRVGDDSLLFHAINRNKRSLAVDLKDPSDVELVRNLAAQADVVISAFRPGVMERLGLGADQLLAKNPRLVFGRVSGYGDVGPWKDRPGQDLLAQALSGLSWLNGNAGDGPVPFGLSVADMYAGNHLVQGVLACLVRRGTSGRGGLADVSLLESILDFQFEVLTTYLNDGGQLPRRSAVNNANAYLPAPYGFYQTSDGHIALSMGAIPVLGELLGLSDLVAMTDERQWWSDRDEIKSMIQTKLLENTSDHWLGILEPAGWWAAPVLSWPELIDDRGFDSIDMLQRLTTSDGQTITTTRCPIRIDGRVLRSSLAAPLVGQHNEEIVRQYDLAGR